MPIEKGQKALVVLSGGQDSTTCLLWAKAIFDEVHAVTFFYGQKHMIEIYAAKQIAQMAGVSHKIIDLCGMLYGTSPLTDPSQTLETYDNPEQMASVIGGRVENTFVPLRNMLFLTVATSYAQQLGCHIVVTGVCQEDNANYPDCTAGFISSFEVAAREALGQHRTDFHGTMLTVATPLMHRTKAETVELASVFEGWEELMAESHTCYAGEVPPCGKCHACVLRADGFAKAGIADPLVEKWKKVTA